MPQRQASPVGVSCWQALRPQANEASPPGRALAWSRCNSASRRMVVSPQVVSPRVVSPQVVSLKVVSTALPSGVRQTRRHLY